MRVFPHEPQGNFGGLFRGPAAAEFLLDLTQLGLHALPFFRLKNRCQFLGNFFRSYFGLEKFGTAA